MNPVKTVKSDIDYHENGTLKPFRRLLPLVGGVKCHITKFYYNIW